MLEASLERSLCHGGNPMASFPAAYSGCTRRPPSDSERWLRPGPSAHRFRQVRRAHHSEQRDQRRLAFLEHDGAAPHDHQAGRRRGRFHPRPLAPQGRRSEQPAGGQVRPPARVVADVAAKLEAAGHLLRVSPLDPGAGRKYAGSRVPGRSVTPLPRSPLSRKSPRESRSVCPARCSGTIAAPARRFRPVPQPSRARSRQPPGGDHCHRADARAEAQHRVRGGHHVARRTPSRRRRSRTGGRPATGRGGSRR